MNKKFFAGIIVLMGISILGIIAVQLVWMNNAIRVKNELFNRSVNEALINTVNKLENLHNFGVLNHMVFETDSFHWANGNFGFNSVPHPPAPPVRLNNSTVVAPNPAPVIRRYKPGNKNSKVEIKIESNRDNSGAYSYQMDSETGNNSNVVVLKNDAKSGNAVFILNNDTIISNVDSLFKISTVKIDSLLVSLDTFNSYLPDISHRAQEKATRLKRIANRVVTEISDWDVRNIDENQVQSVLEEELQNRNIPIQFDYAILKDSNIISKQPVADSLNLLQTEYQVKLYPNDIFQKNLKLAIWFPGRDSF